MDFNKELVYSFGDYVQASNKMPHKSSHLLHFLDFIYLCADDSLQGGHKVMDLATGHMIRRPKVTPCAMAWMVVDRVELLATQQGYKSLKFFNRKHQVMLLENVDLLAGVGGMLVKSFKKIYREADR